jgi:hypothetical protein
VTPAVAAGAGFTREYATRSGPCRGRAGPVSRAVPGPTLWAQLVAQAQHYIRVVPGTGTKRNVLCRASAVLFSAVPGPAHRVSAIWPTIILAARRLSCQQPSLLSRTLSHALLAAVWSSSAVLAATP